MSRIILDCELMKNRNTGLYHYCLNLGTHLQRVAGKNGDSEKIMYYIPPSEADCFPLRAEAIVQHSMHKFFNPFLWVSDVWHATYQGTRIMPLRNRRIKVVLTIHDLNFLHEDASEQQQKDELRQLQILIDRSDALVCISDYCRKDVERHCNTHGKAMHVIHNGGNTLQPASLPTASHIPQQPFLFTLGYVNRKKNFHVLLPLLQDNDLELVIAGKLDDPDYVSHIHQTARQMGIAHKVHVLGPVSEPAKAWYYQNCSAFVFPSIAEGFGLPVVEAMSCGKPLFLSDRTALPEIGGDAAFYFADFEAGHMRQVLRQGMEKYCLENMGDAIRERAKAFSWHKAAEEYLNVYRSVRSK